MAVSGEIVVAMTGLNRIGARKSVKRLTAFETSPGEEKRRFFGKKARKNLLRWAMGWGAFNAHDPAEQKSFCVLFRR
ncbi:MAG: hypothetical protein B7Z81_09415 [Acidocella sp. 20-61-6]|nr:MAG: hypothetical protein B7Z81_09415 [Acidocella sp. 20-61-6]